VIIHHWSTLKSVTIITNVTSKEPAMVVHQQTNNSRRVLSSGEVARFCGVHFRTVIRWIEKGSLKAHKLPGRGNNRIEEQDFIDFLKNNDLPIPREFQSNNSRILICDDDDAMAMAIQRVLKRAGFETLIAHDGFSAGSSLANFKPALMTLDLSMPNMNGFEVLAFLAKEKMYQDVKVLVVSAMEDEKLAQAKAIGAHECLSKPFENKVLVSTVHELLAQH